MTIYCGPRASAKIETRGEKMGNTLKAAWRRVFGFGGTPETGASDGNSLSNDIDDKGLRRRTSVPSLVLSPHRVARAMAFIVLALVLLSIVNSIIGMFFGRIILTFSVAENDVSLAAYYSALSLLLASILLTTIALIHRAEDHPRYALRWAILAAIFLYLSCDEMLMLHERMGMVLMSVLGRLGYEPTGFLSYPWVILYALLLIVFAVAYFRFWLDLPGRIRRLFLIAGALFVVGALGLEMFSAWYEYTFGPWEVYRFGSQIVLVFSTHLEELMEMLGIIIFVYALLSYLSSHMGVKGLRLRLKADSEVET